METEVIHNGDMKKSYPPLEELINQIDRRIEERPHPYASDGFEAFLGSQLGSFKRRGRQYLCFALQQTQLALPMQHTLEITYRTDITPLPNLPHWLLGVTNVRGDIVSVVDLASVLGLPATGAASGAHLILVRNEQMVTGILVDKIIGTFFDEDPNRHFKKRTPSGESFKHFISSIFVDQHAQIYLLSVGNLMEALTVRG